MHVSLQDSYLDPLHLPQPIVHKVIMSLEPPTYLSSLQNNTRARPIPWEGAVRAGTITDNDLKTIKAVDKIRKEQRKQTVESDVEAYQSLILGGSKGKSVLESASKRADVIQYMLVLTGDLINGILFQQGKTSIILLTVVQKMLPHSLHHSSATHPPINRCSPTSPTQPTPTTPSHLSHPRCSHPCFQLLNNNHPNPILRQTKPSLNSTPTSPP